MAEFALYNSFEIKDRSKYIKDKKLLNFINNSGLMAIKHNLNNLMNYVPILDKNYLKFIGIIAYYLLLNRYTKLDCYLYEYNTNKEKYDIVINTIVDLINKYYDNLSEYLLNELKNDIFNNCELSMILRRKLISNKSTNKKLLLELIDKDL